MIHFIIYTFIVSFFKLFISSTNTSRLLASISIATIDIAIIYNINSLFIRIIESIFLTLAILNCIRRIIDLLKRQKTKMAWLKYHSDFDGLNQLVSTKRNLNDMMFNLSEGKEGIIMSKREKSCMETYPQIEEAVSEVFASYERNEISVDTMLTICRNTLNSIEKAFESYNFEPEYLDRTIPHEIRNTAKNQVSTKGNEL